MLRLLINDGLVRQEVGVQDRRERRLFLTDTGRELEAALSAAQRRRMRSAFRNAGPIAVQGFRRVLEEIMDAPMHRYYQQGHGHGDE